MDNLEFTLEDISEVDFLVDVGVKELTPPLESLNVEPSKQEQMFIPESAYGFDKVFVNSVDLQKKNITITDNGMQSVIPDNEYIGLDEVTITVNIEKNEDLSVELTEQNNLIVTQEVTIDDIEQALQGKIASGGVVSIEEYYVEGTIIHIFLSNGQILVIDISENDNAEFTIQKIEEIIISELENKTIGEVES